MAINTSNHCQEASAVVAELLTSGIPFFCTNCHSEERHFWPIRKLDAL